MLLVKLDVPLQQVRQLAGQLVVAQPGNQQQRPARKVGQVNLGHLVVQHLQDGRDDSHASWCGIDAVAQQLVDQADQVDEQFVVLHVSAQVK